MNYKSLIKKYIHKLACKLDGHSYRLSRITGPRKVELYCIYCGYKIKSTKEDTDGN